MSIYTFEPLKPPQLRVAELKFGGTSEENIQERRLENDI